MLSQNRRNDDPALKDVLDLFKKDIFLSLNCHAIANVQSFNPLNRTITATIAYKKTYFTATATGEYIPTSVDYPILTDIPVLVLGGGQASIEFPIQKGDECLLLFNDRDIDNWFASGQVGPVNSLRLHSMSDAIALVGLHSPLNPLGLHDPTHAVFRYKNGAQVGVSASRVLIANAALLSLNTAIQQLVTALNTAFGAIITGPVGDLSGTPVITNPVLITALTAALVQLNAAAAQIGTVIE